MKNAFKFRLFCLVVAYMIASTISGAQDVVFEDSVFSKVLNEQRKLKIYLPEKSGTAKYDVVYILDGEAHFDDFLFIYKFARNQNFIPPLILVGVYNTYNSEGSNRDRDFLPEKMPDNPKAGGAGNFRDFFKYELIPYINNKLPTSGENSLFGHSMGGLFTMYVILNDPELFTIYYCSDPSFPWKNRRIITMTEETFSKKNDLNKTLCIIGTEETYRNVGIGKMDSVLKEAAPAGLRWKTSIYPNESHMSVRLKGIYDGLKYAYYGYNSRKLVEFHPNNGSLLKGKPAAVFLNGSFPDVHYTLDGSEPDTSSETAPQMIEITGPAEVKVKWLGENKKYITSSTGIFEAGNIWPSLRNVTNLKPGGVRYSYYEGKWEILPDFDSLTAAQTGVAESSFSLNNLPRKSDFGCVFEGYIKIDTPAYYSFALCSSDGSRFLLNGHEIINNDGLHGSEWYKSYLVPLQKGFYPVRLEYFQREGSRNFDLIYITPDTHETVKLTFDKWYYK